MKYLVNISIDDVTPHPRSSLKVIKNCKKILDEFPECKFTLFTPVSYWRTKKPGTITKFPLSIDKFHDFCYALSFLDKNNFEVGYHGYYHGIPGKSDNDEFRWINFNDMKKLLSAMKKMVSDVGCEDVFKNILRPPAWRMSPEAIDACVGEIDILALSPDNYPDGSLDYGGKDTEFGNVVYYNVCPPFKPLQLYPKTEIVYHACEWDKNYLNDELNENLIKFLHLNKDKIKFCFMDEMINGKI